MPTISSFYGIFIRMYLRDHLPPHFHAIYQEHDANVAIESGEVIEGRLPHVAARLVRERALVHRQELLDNWNRARVGEPLEKIAGLDND
jgi:Domain of unknown function (DUF4160)